MDNALLGEVVARGTGGVVARLVSRYGVRKEEEEDWGWWLVGVWEKEVDEHCCSIECAVLEEKTGGGSGW